MKYFRALVVSSIVALSFFNPAAAQKIPDDMPADAEWDALILNGLGYYAYCDVSRDRGVRYFSILGYSSFNADYPALEELEPAQLEPSVAAAFDRLSAAGTLVLQSDRYALSQCPATSQRVLARIQMVQDDLNALSDADRAALVMDAVAAYGCELPLQDEDIFAEFSLRRFAEQRDIPLPDPLPEEADPQLTPLVSAYLDALDNGFDLLRRDAVLQVQGDVARFQGCIPTAAPPAVATEAAVEYDTDPATVLARLQAWSNADNLALLVQSLEDVGCSVPEESMNLIRFHFVRNGLFHMGVDLSETELVTVYFELARNYRTDHPHGDAIIFLDGRFSPALAEGLATGVVGQGGASYSLTAPCQSAGDLSLLERYIPDFN
jgi:hypothetical protein